MLTDAATVVFLIVKVAYLMSETPKCSHLCFYLDILNQNGGGMCFYMFF